MTEFTKEELIEIEKAFDNLAGQHVKYAAETTAMLSRGQTYGCAELLKSASSDWVTSWDVMRTISAKAHKMQLEKEE